MPGFVDELAFTVASGHGGKGAVSFRRERYIPKGGPDGGDGGTGGDVFFRVRHDLKTLSHLQNDKLYRASNGSPGRGKRMRGANGDSLIFEVPPGTLIFEEETGTLLCDLAKEEPFLINSYTEGKGWLLIRGGAGGKGNYHFRGPRNQTPRYAQKGEEGQTVRIRLELRLIADVGLIGLPNAGKSSLQRVLTNARPNVASYPFTTKNPNLGVLRLDSHDIIIADIPGLLEGASHGNGLGTRFLRHVSRVSSLLILVDLSRDNPFSDYKVLLGELGGYSKALLARKRIVVGTKLDLPDTREKLSSLQNEAGSETECLALSSFSGEGIKELKMRIRSLADPGQ